MNASFRTTVGSVLRAAEGKLLCGDESGEILSVTSDSRETGEHPLFVPIAGEKFDGHGFIETLCEQKKIDCFLTQRAEDGAVASAHGVSAILCDNTLYALGAVAGAHRASYKNPLVGITGTNGKTTTKELVACALASKGTVIKSEKNYNNEIGVPFTLMGLDNRFDYAVIEMGMNHAGEISRLSAMARPDIAIITNAGEGHLEFLGSVENVAHAKSEIMESMKPGSVIILNEESRCIDIMKDKAKAMRLDVVTFGIEKGDIRPDSVFLDLDSIRLSFRGVDFSVPMYGFHNVSNIMAALACAEYFSLDLSAAAEALAGFKNVGKRSDITVKDFTVINDTYNSNPLSLRYALRSVSGIYRGGRKIAVLSDMKELGEHSESCHRRAGEEVKENGFDRL
ncbi:MAG: UDP-N-acetylmuramoyl-tripeptide--D-alanyl-D-alanine ligase [Spirochaetota bacterium]